MNTARHGAYTERAGTPLDPVYTGKSLKTLLMFPQVVLLSDPRSNRQYYKVKPWGNPPAAAREDS